MSTDQKYIGMATMEADGSIVLDLHAQGPGGMAGSGRIVYKPDNEHYRAVLAHLGGMKPGEKKPVPPWPGQDYTGTH